MERLRDGLRIVIAGPPNSGKSTLLNALAERDAAIVSAISGTTRDRIEAPVIRDGVAYVLTDTAGLREETADPIERIGIDRAQQAIEGADLVLWLGDDAPPSRAMLWIHARADLDGRESLPAGRLLAISATAGIGLRELWHLIGAKGRGLLPRPDSIAVNHRQRALLASCATSLADAAAQGDLLLIAEDLRLAMIALDRIAGRSDVEAMLDTLFRRFCIGK